MQRFLNFYDQIYRFSDVTDSNFGSHDSPYDGSLLTEAMFSQINTR